MKQKNMNIKELLNSIILCLDEKLNIVVKIYGTNNINQIIPTKVNLKDLFIKVFITILKEYKISYKYSDVSKFADILLNSYIKIDYNDEIVPISVFLLIHTEQNVKETMWNYINLFSNKGRETIINKYSSIMLHQLDFNLEKITEISIYNLRVFLIAHFSKLLDKEVVITTQNYKLGINASIDIKELENGTYILSIKFLELLEK